MSNKRQYLLLAAAAFLLGLAALAPASIVASLVQRNLAPGTNFRATAGTVWSGAGTLQLSAAGATIPLSWTFDPTALLRLRLGILLHADAPSVSGTLRVSSRGPSRVEIRDADITADVAQLQGGLPILALLQAGGSVHLVVKDDDRLEILPADALPIRGNFDLSVNQLMLPQWHPSVLGNYVARITDQDTSLDLSLRTTTGLLHAEGSGKLRGAPAREFSFSGAAWPTRPGSELSRLLAAMGRVGSDGRAHIEFRGAW